jgi:lactoylglutathione lyase
MNLVINKLQHVGIPVTDLDISEAFYRSLGFSLVMDEGFEFEGSQGRCRMMQLHDILIELYQMPEPQLSEIRTRSDGQIDHIAFDVSDIEQTYGALKAASFTILQEAPVYLPFWKNGCRFFHILGPDRERIEFNQVL